MSDAALAKLTALIGREGTGISWTDLTFNPWWGCSRVSPACRFCYAADQSKRYGFDVWHRKGDRRMLSESNWAKPRRWNRIAEEAGRPLRVFCASMADVFEDHPQLTEPRERLWELIEATPWLRWQLLTKRPENVAEMAPWGDLWPSHVWIGTSVENQRWAEERIPTLLRIPAAIRFLSCEPLIGPVDLRNVRAVNGALIDCLNGDVKSPEDQVVYAGAPNVVDWVIYGGESGAKARPMDPGWVRSLSRQCEQVETLRFTKQMGAAWAKATVVDGQTVAGHGDRKGDRIEYWPTELQVQECPSLVVR